MGMSRPLTESVKGVHTPNRSRPDQDLSGTKKLYSLWLRALAFLDDDSLFTCCSVSKHLAALSLNPRLWFMADVDNSRKAQNNSLASKNHKKKQIEDKPAGDHQE